MSFINYVIHLYLLLRQEFKLKIISFLLPKVKLCFEIHSPSSTLFLFVKPTP